MIFHWSIRLYSVPLQGRHTFLKAEEERATLTNVLRVRICLLLPENYHATLYSPSPRVTSSINGKRETQSVPCSNKDSKTPSLSRFCQQQRGIEEHPDRNSNEIAFRKDRYIATDSAAAVHPLLSV